MFKILYVG